MFERMLLLQHLVIGEKIFVNAKDRHDPEMAKIKDVIIRESQTQPTWGESLPKCFIPLELEFAALIKRNIPLISLEHLKKMNPSQPIRPLSEYEIKVFLTFHHSIGTVLYFHEQKLDNNIILSPTFLFDAIKYIVTDKNLNEKETKNKVESWDLIGKKGVLSEYDINAVWKKKRNGEFYIHKEYLLDVMNRLDILLKPPRYNSDHRRIPDFYFVASMVRPEDDSRYAQSASFTQRNIAIAFQLSSLMIPSGLSFRFISYCLSVWAVKTYGETNKDMLFHKSGIFNVDPSLDLWILCEDHRIIVRLVHARTNVLIDMGLASNILECLSSALLKISQLYIRTRNDQSHISDAFFITKICCYSPDNPCILSIQTREKSDTNWICPTHGLSHRIHTITSWFPKKVYTSQLYYVHSLLKLGMSSK